MTSTGLSIYEVPPTEVAQALMLRISKWLFEFDPESSDWPASCTYWFEIRYLIGEISRNRSLDLSASDRKSLEEILFFRGGCGDTDALREVLAGWDRNQGKKVGK